MYFFWICTQHPVRFDQVWIKIRFSISNCKCNYFSKTRTWSDLIFRSGSIFPKKKNLHQTFHGTSVPLSPITFYLEYFKSSNQDQTVRWTLYFLFLCILVRLCLWLAFYFSVLLVGGVLRGVGYGGHRRGQKSTETGCLLFFLGFGRAYLMYDRRLCEKIR